MELVGDGGDELLANATEGEQEEDDAGEEDGAQGGLPGDVHALDDGVSEVGVKAHTWRQGKRIVGQGSHHDGTESSAEAGAGGDGRERHAGLGQDRGVHEDDVGHRDEGGEAGEELDAPGGLVLGETEVRFESGSHAWRRPSRCKKFLMGWNRIPQAGVDQPSPPPFSRKVRSRLELAVGRNHLGCTVLEASAQKSLATT
jgi:hypothetical protein